MSLLRVTMAAYFTHTHPSSHFPISEDEAMAFLHISRIYLLHWLKPKISQSNKRLFHVVLYPKDNARWEDGWLAHLMSSAGHLVCYYKNVYSVTQGKSRHCWVGSWCSSIPVRRKPPVESSAQDSASDSCSEKWCVQQRNCPPCYPACSPSCPRLSIPLLASFTFTSHMWPQVKRHNLSLQEINKKGREVRGKRLDS